MTRLWDFGGASHPSSPLGMQSSAPRSWASFVRALPRLVLATKTPVATYLRLTMTHAAEAPDSGAPSTCVWPCPPPYSYHAPLAARCPRRRRKRLKRHCQELLLNLVVAVLGFLAGGSEPFAPAKARVGVPLNGSQWAMVANLEEQLAQWSPFELWAESLSCGRKGLELSDMIRDLEAAAKAFGAPP